MVQSWSICWMLGAIVSNGVMRTSSNPKVRCETTKGDLLIELYPDWSPLGAQRFIELVRDDFFTNIAFYRCVQGFLTQFGITEDSSKKHWHRNTIQDDVNLHLGIKKNYLSYAGGGPNTRSTQLFIAFEDLDFLGNEPWETPFGEVIEGHSTLDSLYKGYGDIPPFGHGPDQQKIHQLGNNYIRTNFPHIDFINSCVLLEDATVASTIGNIFHHEESVELDHIESLVEHDKHHESLVEYDHKELAEYNHHEEKPVEHEFHLELVPVVPVEVELVPDLNILIHNPDSEFLINYKGDLGGSSSSSHVVFKGAFVVVLILVMLCLYRRYSDPKSYYRPRVKRTKSFDAEV